MTDTQLNTDSYKGVRDFYPKEAAVQQYIFTTWSKTAESFGFERYNASVLESAELYKAKRAENEELVHEQTYTFIDRGDREVTLRPEMTPTVARMVAAKRRELQFPLRWYSIPNLFRYERPQRGRLREHWQLNCDIFGSDDVAADVEIIALAYQTLIDFGASPDMFEVRINNRAEMTAFYNSCGIVDPEKQAAVTRLNDRFHKISPDEYRTGLVELVGEEVAETVYGFVTGETSHPHESSLISDLNKLGITNVVVDRSIARGFDYYTSTIFEIFDKSDENNRSLLGGGRYDNLTSMFGGEPISGVGFGMGDVTMKDFLETHNLLPDSIQSTAAKVMVIPMGVEQNVFAQQIAQTIRQADHSVATDFGSKKVGDKISRAGDKGSQYVIVVGEDEVNSGRLTVKNLRTSEETSGTTEELIQHIQ